MSRPSLLITGTSGFLGSRILSALQGEQEVTAIPGRSGFAERLAALSGTTFDAVVHAGFEVDFRPAGANGRESENVENTRRVRDFCRAGGARHLVFFSAAGALGVSSHPRARNEDDLGSTDPPFLAYRETRYIRDKLACEPLLSDLDLPTTVLYPTTVYGPGAPPGHLGPLLGLSAPAPLAPCPPGGTSFLATGDLLDALRRVLERRPNQRLVLSSGNVTYAGLYEAAARALGVAWRKRVVPIPDRVRDLLDLVPERLTARLGLPAAIVASSFGFKYYSAQRAARSLDWLPRGDLEQALRAALAGAAR